MDLTYTDSQYYDQVMLKGKVIKFLKLFNIQTSFISSRFSHDQLLRQYIIEDISRNETTYLVDGIQSIYECLKFVETKSEITRDEIDTLVIDRVANKMKVADPLGQYQRFGEEFVQKLIDQTIAEISAYHKTVLGYLKAAYAEFKIGLGRVNIDIEIIDGIIHFTRFGKEITDMNAIPDVIIENPHPKVFLDLSSYFIFRDLHDVFHNSPTPCADYSFIYRQMFEDGLIIETCKPEFFRQLVIGEPYNASKVEPKIIGMERCKTNVKWNFYNKIKSVRQRTF